MSRFNIRYSFLECFFSRIQLRHVGVPRNMYVVSQTWVQRLVSDMVDDDVPFDFL